MGIENNQQEKFLNNIENKESINDEINFSEIDNENNSIKQDLKIVENKIKNLKKNNLPEDDFDETVLNTLGGLQKEMNRISQENNLEYSYVQFIYNLVQEYWENIDLNNMNTAWYSSLYDWENYEANIINNDKLISDISGDKPTLIFSNHNSVITSLEDYSEDWIFNQQDKHYQIIWTAKRKIDSNIQPKTIEKEIVIDEMDDINNTILYQIIYLAKSIKVTGKSKSTMAMDSSKNTWSETLLQDYNTYQSLTISNLEIGDIKKIKVKGDKRDKWVVKIKFNLYQ